MELTDSDKFHLYARAAFFAHESELPTDGKVERVVDGLFKSAKSEPLKYALPKLDPSKKLSQKEKRERRKTWRGHVREINALWVRQMMNPKNALVEKMTLFWHGHFACRTVVNPYHSLDLNNRLRKHALGSFRDLLYAVAQSAAMINYLHLRQNKKGSPNEDFARELCELFTLGRDVDYTEKDVVEIARAFTGWTVNAKGEHLVNERQHDNGVKTIFGKTGNFTGNDVIEMILENPHTADFIAKKIYRFFVREHVNEKHVKELSQVLYKANYDIAAMMRHLFTAKWFYQAKGELVKGPVDLLVGFGRIFDLKYADTKTIIRVQYYLGQALFDPPNVAGWAGGRNWIDSSRLAFRLRMGAMIVNRGVVEVELSPALDDMLTKKTKKQKKFLKLYEEVDWSAFYRRNPSGNYEQVLLRTENKRIGAIPFESKIEQIVQLISTPDFQLT